MLRSTRVLLGNRCVSAAFKMAGPFKHVCEDAIMLPAADSHWIGIADGVGGYNEFRDGDPAAYAQAIMDSAQQGIAAADSADGELLTLVRMLESGVVAAKQINGGCTALLAAVSAGGSRLTGFAFGDSQLQLLRPAADGQLQSVAVSPAMEVGFNQPVQLGSYGHDLDWGQPFAWQLQEGDVLIMASDGLWDNIPPDAVATLPFLTTLNAASSEEDVSHAVDALGTLAMRVADGAEELPVEFEKQLRFPGGKPDDTSVVVTVIRSVDASQDGGLLPFEEQVQMVKETYDFENFPASWWG
eukprot:PLAT372.1.p1 GENE.PLAT372.1~~PLAT372.1.p1  ORF type:complete len:299 (-),score=127.24 PLAT372.1:35-931(-)